MSSDGPIHVFYWPLEMVGRVQRQSSHIVFQLFFFFFHNRRLTHPRRHCHCRVGAFSPSIAKMAKVHYHSLVFDCVCVWSEMAFRRVFPVFWHHVRAKCVGCSLRWNGVDAIPLSLFVNKQQLARRSGLISISISLHSTPLQIITSAITTITNRIKCHSAIHHPLSLHLSHPAVYPQTAHGDDADRTPTSTKAQQPASQPYVPFTTQSH